MNSFKILKEIGGNWGLIWSCSEFRITGENVFEIGRECDVILANKIIVIIYTYKDLCIKKIDNNNQQV